MNKNSNNNLNPSDSEQISVQEEIAQIYKSKGLASQKQSYKEYLALKKQQEERKKFKLPAPVQYILATPLLLIFCLGLIFIPFIIYLFLTAK